MFNKLWNTGSNFQGALKIYVNSNPWRKIKKIERNNPFFFIFFLNFKSCINIWHIYKSSLEIQYILNKRWEMSLFLSLYCELLSFPFNFPQHLFSVTNNLYTHILKRFWTVDKGLLKYCVHIEFVTQAEWPIYS